MTVNPDWDEKQRLALASRNMLCMGPAPIYASTPGKETHPKVLHSCLHAVAAADPKSKILLNSLLQRFGDVKNSVLCATPREDLVARVPCVDPNCAPKVPRVEFTTISSGSMNKDSTRASQPNSPQHKQAYRILTTATSRTNPATPVGCRSLLTQTSRSERALWLETPPHGRSSSDSRSARSFSNPLQPIWR